MTLFKRNSPEYYAEVYLTFPTFIIGRKTESLLGGDNSTTKINVNLFNFNLTRNPLYIILEIGLIVGIGIKIIDKDKENR